METELRREQIAEAALQVVQTYGLKGLSMERIASEVGLVPSAIYRHFKNKGKVLDAALDLLHDRLTAIVAAAHNEEKTPLARLKALLVRHVALVQHFQAIPRLLFSDQVCIGNPARKAKLYAIVKDYLTKVAAIAREGQAEGTIRKDLDAQTIAVLFLGLFHPAVILWFISDGQFDTKKHVNRAWRAFCEGIRPVSV